MSCPQTFKTMNIFISRVLGIRFTFTWLPSSLWYLTGLILGLEITLLSSRHFDFHEEEELEFILLEPFVF